MDHLGFSCHNYYCDKSIGCINFAGRNAIAKLKDILVTDITHTPYFNSHEVTILKNYLQTKSISYANMWTKCMAELTAGNYHCK